MKSNALFLLCLLLTMLCVTALSETVIPSSIVLNVDQNTMPKSFDKIEGYSEGPSGVQHPSVEFESDKEIQDATLTILYIDGELYYFGVELNEPKKLIPDAFIINVYYENESPVIQVVYPGVQVFFGKDEIRILDERSGFRTLYKTKEGDAQEWIDTTHGDIPVDVSELASYLTRPEIIFRDILYINPVTEDDTVTYMIPKTRAAWQRTMPVDNERQSFVQDSNGTRFVLEDGSYAANQWIQTGENWYYFGEDQYLRTNQWQGEYYLLDNGAMAVSMWVDESHYVDEHGKIVPDAVKPTEGQWRMEHNRWWFQKEDGSYPVSEWVWIDGDIDGYAECYYFDKDGYLVTSDRIHGWHVNKDGAWQNDSNVQRRYAPR